MYASFHSLKGQYKLCFEILQSHLDSFDTYANFKAVWSWVVVLQGVKCVNCVLVC